MRIEVHDAAGRVLAAGRDLRALQREWLDAGGVRAASARRRQRSRARTSRIGTSSDLPDTVALQQAAREVQLYPSLLDVQGRVDLRLLPPGPSAVEQHRRGVRRLLLKNVPQQVALVRERALEGPRAAARVSRHRHERCARRRPRARERGRELRAGAADPGARRVRARRSTRAAPSSSAKRTRCARCCARCSPRFASLRRELDAASGKGAQPRVRDEIAAQLAQLVAPYCLSATPPEWRKHLPRYLRAARARWEKRGDRQDAELAQQIAAAAAPLERWRAEWPDGWPWPAAMVEYRWLSRSCACRCSRNRSARRGPCRRSASHAGRGSARALARGVADAGRGSRRSSSTAGCSRSCACRCSRNRSARRGPCRRSASSRPGSARRR